jgi:molecular chaperone DnaJ
MASNADMAQADHYGALGIAPDATQKKIKEAFKKLALRYHPDRARSSVSSSYARI